MKRDNDFAVGGYFIVKYAKVMPGLNASNVGGWFFTLSAIQGPFQFMKFIKRVSRNKRLQLKDSSIRKLIYAAKLQTSLINPF
jgi:hypothetical protein